MVGNGIVEKDTTNRALSLAEVVKNLNMEDKDFETFLKTLHTLAKNLDTNEFKNLSKILEDLAGIFEDAYKFSKLLRVKDLVDLVNELDSLSTADLVEEFMKKLKRKYIWMIAELQIEMRLL